MSGLMDVAQAASNAVAGNVSGPVDMLALLLRKAGVPVPEDPVLGTEWLKKRGLIRDVPQGAAQVAGETLGLLAPVAVAAKASQIASGLLRAQENAAAPRTLRPDAGAIVWHGSPHKFDRFDSSKIGTGEGAQAYGHGLYLAEARGVGADYADVLASPRNRVADRRGVYIEPSPIESGKYMLATRSEVGQPRGMAADATQFLYTDKQFPNIASAVKFARQKGLLSRNERQRLTAIGEDRQYVPVTRAADVAEPEYTQFIASDPGYLYKVDLPDDKIARMLDWDKPLSQQAPEVRAAITRIPGVEYADDYFKANRNAAPTGADIHEFLRLSGYNPNQIAPRMSDAGIPGIRYLDGGSRGAGSGTSNFVVFPGEEGLLTILERNGVPLGR